MKSIEELMKQRKIDFEALQKEKETEE